MTRFRALVTRKLPSSVLDKLGAIADVDVYVGDAAIPYDELRARVAGCDALVSLLTDKVDRAVDRRGAEPEGHCERRGRLQQHRCRSRALARHRRHQYAGRAQRIGGGFHLGADPVDHEAPFRRRASGTKWSMEGMGVRPAARIGTAGQATRAGGCRPDRACCCHACGGVRHAASRTPDASRRPARLLAEPFQG